MRRSEVPGTVPSVVSLALWLELQRHIFLVVDSDSSEYNVYSLVKCS